MEINQEVAEILPNLLATSISAKGANKIKNMIFKGENIDRINR
jgi:hypothetical protein